MRLLLDQTGHVKGDYIIPATSRLIRRRIIVSVNSSGNRSVQLHRQATSDTEDNRRTSRSPLQASRRRRALLARSLLGSNDTVEAVLELEGTTSAAALSINSNLATNVLNGALQVGWDRTLGAP